MWPHIQLRHGCLEFLLGFLVILVKYNIQKWTELNFVTFELCCSSSFYRHMVRVWGLKTRGFRIAGGVFSTWLPAPSALVPAPVYALVPTARGLLCLDSWWTGGRMLLGKAPWRSRSCLGSSVLDGEQKGGARLDIISFGSSPSLDGETLAQRGWFAPPGFTEPIRGIPGWKLAFSFVLKRIPALDAEKLVLVSVQKGVIGHLTLSSCSNLLSP